MGWKGTVRSINASIRRAERESQRRHRELEREAKAAEKYEALQQAKYEVEVFENYLDVIQSVHKEKSERVEWETIANSPEPIEPVNTFKRFKKAQYKIKNYKPGFFARFLKLEARQARILEKKVHQAKLKDEEEFQKEYGKYLTDSEAWQSEIKLAKGVIEGDANKKLEALKQLDPFSDISELGSEITFKYENGRLLSAVLIVKGESVVPKEVKSLLQSGKLSVKKMPVSKFFEIYQDYVCSCALRVGAELMAILPENLVVVTAKDEILNTATGHKELCPILSVAFSRKTLDGLVMDAIDPSDSMQNFIHKMNFKKTKGFQMVDVITEKDFDA